MKRNTTLSEQFKNPTEKKEKEAKSIPLTTHKYTIPLTTHTYTISLTTHKYTKSYFPVLIQTLQ